MKNKNLTLHELEQISKDRLVHYEGDGRHYEGDQKTMFNGNDLVSFDPGIGGINGGKAILTLTNANTAERTAVLCPGILSSVAGKIATGAFNDAGGNAGLTGAMSPKSIELFLEFIRRNPTQLLQMKVQSTEATQVEKMITYQRQSPFRDLTSEYIYLSLHQDENTFKDKVVTVPTLQYGLNFDDQTYISFPVVGSSTCTITLQFGPIANLARFLDKTVKAEVQGVQAKFMGR